MTDTPCGVSSGCDPCTLPSEAGCRYVKCTKEQREQVREYEHIHTVEEHVIHKPKCQIQYVTVHHRAPCEKIVVGCPCTCPETQDGFVRDGCVSAPAVVYEPPVVTKPLAAAAAAVAEVQFVGANIPPGARIVAEAEAIAVAPAPAVVRPACSHVVAPVAAPVVVAAAPARPATISMAHNPSTSYGYRWVPPGM